MSVVPSRKPNPSERLESAFTAAHEGRLTPERVQRMQEGGEDLMQADDHGRALICVAAESRNWTAVERLAAMGGGIADTIDSAGLAPLHYAAQTGAASTVRALLDAGASPFLKDCNGRTPGEHAAASDDLPTLQALHLWILRNCRSATRGSSDAGTLSAAGALGPAAPRLLHAAAAAGCNDIVSWILRTADLSVNVGVAAAASGNVHSAMTRAAIAGRLETVKLLVNTHHACIKPSADAPAAVSAAHAAAEARRADVVTWLLQRAPGLLSLKDFRGYGLMHAAAAGGDVTTLRVVMDAIRARGGKNVNVVINWRSLLPADVRAAKAAAAAVARKAKAAAKAEAARDAAADAADATALDAPGPAKPAGLARRMSEDEGDGDGNGDAAAGGADLDAIAHVGEEDVCGADEKTKPEVQGEEEEEEDDGYAPAVTYTVAEPVPTPKLKAQPKAQGAPKAQGKVAAAAAPAPVQSASNRVRPGPAGRKPPSAGAAGGSRPAKAAAAVDADDCDSISLDGRGPLGWTPLALAVTCGKHAAAQLLLSEAGAKVDALAPGGADGETHWPPLFFAAENDDAPMLDLLLAAGASTSFRDADLRTAAHIAAAAGGSRALAALAEVMSVDLFMARDARQATVLHGAATAGSAEAMTAILTRCRMHERARASDEDIAGRSPLSIAKAGGHAAVVGVLRAML